MTGLPRWAEWKPEGARSPWTVCLEQEVMLLDPRDWSLASRIDDVLAALPPELAGHAAPETHGSVLELASLPHPTVAGAVGELASLRAGLAASLAPLELRAAVCGTHPFAQWSEVDENRFLATRDGMRAEFIDPARDTRRPVREILDELLAACGPHALDLGCEAALAAVHELAAEPGYHRQRLLAGTMQGEPVGPGLGMLVSALAACFSAGSRPAEPRSRAGSAHSP